MTTPDPAAREGSWLVDTAMSLNESERLLITLGFGEGVQDCEGFLETMWSLRSKHLVDVSGIACCLTMDGHSIREFFKNPRLYGG